MTSQALTGVLACVSNSTLAQRGAWSVTVGAAIWGLFWIPLRYLDSLGVHGLWAVSLVLLAASIPACITTVWQGELGDLQNRSTWQIGFALGLSAVLYFIGVMLSDVIRVIFLFYLLPVWTTIAARLIYGERICSSQLLVIALALSGVWLLLGGGTAMPLPDNAGDWCGIGAGMCWGVSLALLRGRDTARAYASATAALSVGSLLAVMFAVVFTFLIVVPGMSPPGISQLVRTAPVVITFGVLVLFPAITSQIWGARLIPAPTAALLTMSEIVVATVSAYLLAGTELTHISILGAGVILLSVVIDLRLKFNRGVQ